MTSAEQTTVVVSTRMSPNQKKNLELLAIARHQTLAAVIKEILANELSLAQSGRTRVRAARVDHHTSLAAEISRAHLHVFARVEVQLEEIVELLIHLVERSASMISASEFIRAVQAVETVGSALDQVKSDATCASQKDQTPCM